MPTWRSDAFRTEALRKGYAPDIAKNAAETGRAIVQRTPGAQVVLSLAHLGHLTETRYANLRALVARRQPDPYRTFRIRKRPLPGEGERYRVIAVPSPWLMNVQRWINANVLKHTTPHEASTAFAEGDNIFEAARPHCGCRWLLKIDLQNFFESVTEAQVYRVFEDLGYQPLVAFELARICTRMRPPTTREVRKRFKSTFVGPISSYAAPRQGHLPQGAPTSPMIANLAARNLDERLRALADNAGFVYSRYADDLTFSTLDETIDRAKAAALIGPIYKIIGSTGFTPNTAKTRLVSPGARKIMLGLLIDGEHPRLTREFKLKLRQHLHYLLHPQFGAAKHASHLKATVHGLQRHIHGLIQYARQIEPDFGAARLLEFEKVVW